MKRRAFIALLGGAAVSPLLLAPAARAQQQKRIGFLGATTPATARQWTAAFEQRIRELGWIEGRNVAIDYRWVDGRSDRSPAILAEFVRSNVDVIVTWATANVVAAKKATPVIPIVFALAADPVGNKLVASLNRPGGNVTGLSLQRLDLAGKRLELLREVMPGVRRLAILVNAASLTVAVEIDELAAAGRPLGIEIATAEVRSAADIASAIAAIKGRADALYVPGDALLNANYGPINTAALAAWLPTIFSLREQVEAGGLMSYGPHFPDMFRRTGELVDKILRGAKPADLPVEQPTRFELVFNLKTAKALGLAIPESFLLRADEVIE
jgi:putative ABC transport system substrate-binding protein